MRATFLLDIQSKKPAGDPLVFAFTQSKPGPQRILSITALTQQKLCYFVAFIGFKNKSSAVISQ